LLKGYLYTGLTTLMIYFTNIHVDILCVVQVNSTVTIQFLFVFFRVASVELTLRTFLSFHSDVLSAVFDHAEFRYTST
jgi:hypothetical protein